MSVGRVGNVLGVRPYCHLSHYLVGCGGDEVNIVAVVANNSYLRAIRGNSNAVRAGPNSYRLNDRVRSGI